MEAVERDIDTLGRIVIPKAWRKQLGQHIVLFRIGDEVRLRPKRAPKFTELPKMPLSVKAPLTDWHAVHKELME